MEGLSVEMTFEYRPENEKRQAVRTYGKIFQESILGKSCLGRRQ